jgi:hypothetical protein
LILEEGEALVRHGRNGGRGRGRGRGIRYGLGGCDREGTRPFAPAALVLDGLDGTLRLGEGALDIVALGLEKDDAFFPAPRLFRAAHAAPSVRRRLT